MRKKIVIFILMFLIIMALNQMYYGSCFKLYCLKAAVVGVAIKTIIVTIILSYLDISNELIEKIIIGIITFLILIGLVAMFSNDSCYDMVDGEGISRSWCDDPQKREMLYNSNL